MLFRFASPKAADTRLYKKMSRTSLAWIVVLPGREISFRMNSEKGRVSAPWSKSDGILFKLATLKCIRTKSFDTVDSLELVASVYNHCVHLNVVKG
ncbi:hypothetical protein HOLleu_05569 [Holothuria leucospilota]|uniref:Uncharacterized protein n=1 Tax=Holothuria leucospilota TaxID=206669 RepID=A0A9Q1HJ46_HOLLE|nr:hypothetical protein HOLleu_05569 [Holothuria leucospilota]